MNDWLVPYLADLIKSPAVGGVAAVIAAAIAWFATKKDRRHREAELVAAARARIALDKRQGRTPPQHLVELVNRPRGADVDQEERYSAPAAAPPMMPGRMPPERTAPSAMETSAYWAGQAPPPPPPAPPSGPGERSGAAERPRANAQLDGLIAAALTLPKDARKAYLLNGARELAPIFPRLESHDDWLYQRDTPAKILLLALLFEEEARLAYTAASESDDPSVRELAREFHAG